MAWIRKNLITIVLYSAVLAGTLLIAYPSFSDWWNGFHQSRAIAAYSQAVANMKTEEYEKILSDAEAYNSAAKGEGMLYAMTEEEKASYESELAIDDSGMMGYIDIPKIEISLPVYHGVDEAVLQTAIGHIPGTSLPVGGEGTHSVLSGHRGLPSAKLFTDIDKLVEGDTWTLSILNRTLTYEVDQIRIVEPTDLSNLTLEEGMDYCTLVTCTPYGVNTHRLLVRGHRVANAQGEAEIVADAVMIDSDYTAPFVAVPILGALFVWIMVRTRRKPASSGRKSGKRMRNPASSGEGTGKRMRKNKGEFVHHEGNEKE